MRTVNAIGNAIEQAQSVLGETSHIVCDGLPLYQMRVLIDAVDIARRALDRAARAVNRIASLPSNGFEPDDEHPTAKLYR